MRRSVDPNRFMIGLPMSSCYSLRPQNLCSTDKVKGATLRNFLLLLTVLSFSIFSVAQDHKNELGLLIGGTLTPSLSTKAGAPVDFSSGIAYQADYAHRLVKNNRAALWLEFPVIASPSVGNSSADTNIPKENATFFATPSFRVNFAPQRTFSPWVSFGGGVGWYQQANRLINGAPRTSGDRNSVRGTLQWGGGVDIAMPVKIKFPIGLRAEIRDFYTLGTSNFISPVRENNQHNLEVSGGIVLRFR